MTLADIAISAESAADGQFPSVVGAELGLKKVPPDLGQDVAVISVYVHPTVGGEGAAIAKAIVREVLENLIHAPIDNESELCISRFLVQRSTLNACVNALQATLSFYGFDVQATPCVRCGSD